MKFLKVSLLLSVYILMWSMNSFVFASPPDPPVSANAIQEVDTHIIPFIVVDGQLTRIQEILEAINKPDIN